MQKQNSQSIGDVSNSSTIGNNVNGNGINITHNDISGLIELQKGYQEMIHNRDEQINRLIGVIERFNDKNK